jgi:hypothetical protein
VTTSARTFDPAADAAAAETILRAARALSSVTAEPGRVATVIAEIVSSEISADGALAVELDGISFRVEGAAGELAQLAGEHFRAEGSLALRAITERRAVLQDNSSGEAEECELARRVNAREVLAAPMFAGGIPVGALIAIRCSEGMFSDRDVATVARLAELASLAMHNARLLERERQGAREATALADIVHELNQSLELERVVSIVAEKALAPGGRARADNSKVTTGRCQSGRAIPFGKRLPVNGSSRRVSCAGRPCARPTSLPRPLFWCRLTSQDRRAVPSQHHSRRRPSDRRVVVVGNAEHVFSSAMRFPRALAPHGAIAIENS